VHDGSVGNAIAPVPVPAAAWLLLSGLGGLGVLGRQSGGLESSAQMDALPPTGTAIFDWLIDNLAIGRTIGRCRNLACIRAMPLIVWRRQQSAGLRAFKRG
jgi:hypothetical protein